MTDPRKELNELKDLQEQSQMLREQRDEAHKGEELAPQATAEEELDSGEKLNIETKLTAENEEGEEGLSDQIADIMSELDVAAAEHPSLALLAAFGIGVFVGQLLSRR